MNTYKLEFEKSYRDEQYNEYLQQHISNVKRGFEWLEENLPDIVNNKYKSNIVYNIENHDASKYYDEEFDAYAEYFYGKQTEEVEKRFDYAWLHHIHNNPHHWQYWVLINDTDGTVCLDMPYDQIVAMFCDHWAFSWQKGNLKEIQNWYNKNKSTIMFSDKTKSIYETILENVMAKVDNI